MEKIYKLNMQLIADELKVWRSNIFHSVKTFELYKAFEKANFLSQ